MDYVKAFLIGGLIYAPVQILMEKTKMMPGRTAILLVVNGTIPRAVRIYEPFAKQAGAEAGVLPLRFGSALWKGVKGVIGKDGILGILKEGLTASSAGICGALVFGYLASLVFKPKMKQGVVRPDIKAAGNGELPPDGYGLRLRFRLLLYS